MSISSLTVATAPPVRELGGLFLPVLAEPIGAVDLVLGGGYAAPMDEQRWRNAWQVGDDDEQGLGLPDALHSSGLAIKFIYTDVDEDEMGWCATVPAPHQRRLAELRAELGESAVEQLFAEARQLWAELGYSDASPFKRTS